jgi:hypothetical protein
MGDVESTLVWIHRTRKVLGTWWFAVGLFHLFAVINGISTRFGFVGFIVPVILALVILLPEINRCVVLPLLRMVDNIYYPTDSSDRPPLNYRLADAYLGRGHTEDALEEYLHILHFHPQELPAYIAAISILLEREEDELDAKKLFRTGMRKIRNEGHRNALKNAFGGNFPGEGEYAFVGISGLFEMPILKRPGSRWQDYKKALQEWVRRIS